MRKNKVLSLIAINLTIFGLLLLLIELFFGAWVFKNNQLDFFGVSPNMDEKFEIDLYTETPIVVRHTRDRYGLRGQNSFNQPEKIDILAIGGSTTFQKFIDDADTWDSILEQKLNAAGKNLVIANAGINGHSTHAHIKAFDVWLKNIEGLKPRYLLFYIGINDYLPRPFLLPENTDTSPLKETLQNNSVIYNVLRRAKGAYLAKKGKFETSEAIDFSLYEFTRATLLPQAYLDFYREEFVPAYQQRVQKLIELSEAMGAEPIFVTQPMALYELKDEAVLGVKDARQDFVTRQAMNGVDAYQLINHLNEGLREICKDKYKVVELTSLPIWEKTDFHDWFHNTPQGAQKVADQIWKQIRTKLK